MKTPTIKHTLNDTQAGVMYHVFAYRPLTRTEIILAVRQYRIGRKKPKRGEVISFATILGHTD